MWEGDDLVTYDFEAFLEQHAFYESNGIFRPSAMNAALRSP